MTAIEFLDRPPTGWFVLDVMRFEARKRNWVALMIDVDPDDLGIFDAFGERRREMASGEAANPRDQDLHLSDLVETSRFSQDWTISRKISFKDRVIRQAGKCPFIFVRSL